jgi:UDP-N-acetylglucosamine transferase subunit ALG13
MKKKLIKLGLVCASGGHFEQMLNLSDFYVGYPHFWITHRNVQTESALKAENRYFIRDAHFKRPWAYIQQLPKTLSTFLKEKPSHMLSTGSGSIVFIPFILSLLFRAKFIHVDTFSHVRGLTIMGKLLYNLGFPVLTQWESPRKTKAIYVGPIMKRDLAINIAEKATQHVFVTVGTLIKPFPRLIQAVETLKKDGMIKDKVFVQAGYTNYESDIMEVFDFTSPERIDRLIRDAKYVITQESAGIGTKCLKYGKKFIVMPRDYSRNELRSKSDMNEDLHIKLAELGFVFIVHDVEEMRTAISKLDSLKVGFEFDNRRAVQKLRELVESP